MSAVGRVFLLINVYAGSEARGLLKKALTTPLTPEQSQSIAASLEADPNLVSRWDFAWRQFNI